MVRNKASFLGAKLFIHRTPYSVYGRQLMIQNLPISQFELCTHNFSEWYNIIVIQLAGAGKKGKKSRHFI